MKLGGTDSFKSVSPTAWGYIYLVDLTFEISLLPSPPANPCCRARVSRTSPFFSRAPSLQESSPSTTISATVAVVGYLHRVRVKISPLLHFLIWFMHIRFFSLSCHDLQWLQPQNKSRSIVEWWILGLSLRFLCPGVTEWTGSVSLIHVLGFLRTISIRLSLTFWCYRKVWRSLCWADSQSRRLPVFHLGGTETHKANT